jgi:hypothetical protein
LLFASLLSLNFSGDATASDVRVAVTDSTCTCTSQSDRTFDCKFIAREIRRQTAGNRTLRSDRKNYRTVSDAVIKRYLDSTGYFDARRDTAADGTFHIYPGRRTIIRNERLALRRLPSSDSAEISISPAEYPLPFNAADVALRAVTICSTFTGSGYPFATVTADILPTGGSDTIELQYTIDSDEPYLFAPPQLRGTFTTNHPIILRDIPIKPGATFDDRVIARALELLHTRNYISRARALPPVITLQTAGDSGARRGITVPFEITDRSGLGLEGAAGLESGTDEAPRFNGNIRFAFANLFHAGEEASLTYTGDRSRQRLDIDYSQPWLLGLPLTGNIGGGLEVVSDAYGYIFGNAGLYYEPRIRWRTGLIISGNQISRKDQSAGNGTFGGADLAFIRSPEPFREGTLSRELAIITGSGITKKERMFSRSHVDFAAGLHLPMWFRTALLLRGGTGHIITSENDLVASELYRIGRSIPVRGYADDEYAFRTVVYAQTELLYYFQHTASTYLFFDGGMGFEGDIGTDRSHRNLAGYGIGVRLPAGIGSLSLEWGRNITDTRNLGRIHVLFRNSFAAADKPLFSITRK